MKTLIAILGVLAVLIAVVAGSYISNYNYGNRAEKTIEAEYTNMENILAQYSLKVKEAAQIPGMKADDLVRVTKEAMAGRYGDGGSKAAFQWIQENYPGQVTDATYVKIQQIMEAGRNKFENAQTKFIDTKRAYETNLGYLWKGMWLRIAGYPSIDLDDYKIVSSGHAKKAFETGIDEAIQLR
jgi:hypothetical protein